MLAAILVVALVLRAWSIRHGLPFVYNIDEEQHFVSKAARFFGGGDLDPGYFENPPGLTYLLWVAFAVRYAGDNVRSLFHNDPGAVYLTGREVVAVLGTAVVAATYALGSRFARDRHAGLVAAGVMAVAFVPVWYSKQALNDMPAVLPATIALVLALRYADEGRRRDLLHRRPDGRARGQHEVHRRGRLPGRRRRRLAALAADPVRGAARRCRERSC